MTSPPLTAEAEFLRLRDELLTVQHDLSRRLRACAEDPRLDSAEVVDTLQRLRERRDALLMRWGRSGLTFLLKGGEILLRDPSPVVKEPAQRTEPPATRAAMVEAMQDRASEPPPAPSPPPSPPPKVEPVGPPPDPAALNKLAAGGMNPSWSRASQTAPRDLPPPTNHGELLKSLRAVIGDIPTDYASPAALRSEAAALAGAIRELDHWPEAPREAQQAMVGHIVARARQLQDNTPDGLLDSVEALELDRVFSVLTAYSKREQPGFVFGLMRTHSPTQGSWLEDARMWSDRLDETLLGATPGNPERALDSIRELLDSEQHDTEAFLDAVAAALDAGVSVDDSRLVRLSTPYMEELKTQARFKRLRKAIRQAEDDTVTDDEDFARELASGATEPPEDWALADFVAGRRAVLIGGDRREEARERIQAAFRLESLDWVSTDHSRNFQSVANRIQSGGCDLVILLRRFIGHDVDRIVLPACRSSEVPWVSVDRGYGVSQIRVAMDRFLSPSESA
jgi:hypothetical protein